MSNRLISASAVQAGLHRRRSCAWALAILVMAWQGVPGAARADAIILRNGESIDGSIVDATRNTVIIRRAIGGMRQMRIQDIAEVRVDLVQGEQIAGQFLGWVDGVHEVRTGGEILRIRAGRILTRERRDQATTPPPRRLPQPPLAPEPGKEPPVQAAAPAATAPNVERAGLTRARAAVAEAASARGSAAAATAGTSRAKAEPAAAVPALVEPTRTAAAPLVVAPAVARVAEAGNAAPAAEASTVKVTPAAVSAQATPAVAALSRAPKIEAETASTAPAEVGPAEPKVVAAVLPRGEVRGSKAANWPEEQSDDQILAVRGTVVPAEADADGIVFRIELSRPAEQPVVLIYGTVDGTAIAGQDYEPQQGVVTLTPGSRSADVRVPLIEHRRPRVAGFELFLTADPKVATVIEQRISATIPAAD